MTWISKTILSSLTVAACAAISGLAAAQKSNKTKPLPDGETRQWRGYSAWLVEPVRRYGHGVLGDAIEAGGFAIRQPSGKTLFYHLGKDAVFEDRRVRLVKIRRGNEPQALVIKSYLRRGAAIALYAIRNNRIVQLAEGPAIGQRNRWLNIVGVADFNKDGRMDIAYVQTPHLAGILRIFTWTGKGLRELAQRSGYTNHVIGSRNLDLATIRDFNRDGKPDILIPLVGGRGKAILSLQGNKIIERDRIAN